MTFVFVRNFPYRSFIGFWDQQLRVIQTRINKNRDIAQSNDAGQFRKTLERVERLSLELDQIEQKFRNLENIRKMALFLNRFFKKSLIFQSVNLVIALFFFPITAYYLNFLLPDFTIPHNIWPYQKWVLILGGLTGIFLAILTSTKIVPKK